MKIRSASRRAAELLAASIFLVACNAAIARLGDDVASIETDRVQLKVAKPATILPSPDGSVTSHSFVLAHGTSVKEYVSSFGIVFAIRWSGPFKPDLRQLLGTYFDKYVESRKSAVQRVEPPSQSGDSDLVVSSGGHPREFSGIAYLRSLMPPGVKPSDLK